MKKQKVLFVINTLGCAGAEKALIELLKQFSPDEYKVSLYILLGQGEMIHEIPKHVKILNKNYSDASVLSKEGKQQLAKGVLRRLFVRGSLFKNIPYIMTNGIDMICKKNIKLEKLLWRIMADSAGRTKTKYDLAVAYIEGGSTYYVHDYVHATRKMTFFHVDYEQAGYSRKLDKDCYRDFDRIFTVSDEVKESFLNAYPECNQRTYVFHNLIDQEGIRKKAQCPGGFTDSYNGKRILTVGRLTSQKAYEVAIDAMKLLKDSGVEARWYVLGEGELRKKLQRQIDQLGLTNDFILVGAVENPYPYYAQCDLYVHATRFEGKSIAVQEAQTLGCTILVSDCNGNREQVQEGVDGAFCQLTPQSISEQIQLLLKEEQLSKQYGKMAQQKINETRENVLQLFE